MKSFDEKKKDLFDIMDASDTDVHMKAQAMLALLDVESEQWAEVVASLESQFPPDKLAKFIKFAMVEKIKKLREYREGIYTRNDELRAKGVPFSERAKLLKLDRIAMCERKEAELADHARRFRVRPLREWLSRFDLDMAKRRGVGMVWIIGFNLEHTYVVPEK